MKMLGESQEKVRKILQSSYELSKFFCVTGCVGIMVKLDQNIKLHKKILFQLLSQLDKTIPFA